MEYDKSTAATTGPASSGAAHTTTTTTSNSTRGGNVRLTGHATTLTPLSNPLTFPFSGKMAQNRFLKAPMTERLCTWNTPSQPLNHRGHPTPEYTHLYRRWGEGSIGMIVSGNTMVAYDAVEAYGNPILCDDHDGRVAAFGEVVKEAKKHGSLIVAQISHPGRQGTKWLNPNPVSASDVHLQIKWAGNEFAKPRPMEVEEIKEMARKWGETAFLCWKAGFDGVQVHCAHGYLLAQFLSPSTNHRTDEYGGPLVNRSRLVFEIISEIDRRVRQHDPSFIVCVKLNSVEFQDKGTTPEEARELAQMLEAARVDFVDLSGGTFEARAFEHKKESTKKREAYFIEFAEQLRPLLKKTKVYVTGGLRTAEGMVKAIESGACDGVGIGRPLAAEPYLCKEILEGKITGAIESVMPLPLNTQSSGTQLHQIGRGQENVSDWSVQEEVERWQKANKEEEERKIKILPVVDSSGYAWIEPVNGFAYLK